MRGVVCILWAVGFCGIHCQNNPVEKTDPQAIHTDTVIRDIPEWYSSSSYGKKWDKQLNSQLSLRSIKNGFDSLSIRIWINCGDEVSNLIVIERTESYWEATFYSYIAHYDEELNIELRDLIKDRRSPKSGWNIFSTSLFKTDITNLQDSISLVEEYLHPTDADDVLVEVGRKKQFRLYLYPELGMNSHIVEGPGKLHKALKLIETEFNYKRPCQDSNR